MATTKWTLDPVHSELQFKIRHLMISNVTGDFKKFDGTVETEGDDLTTAKVQFSADVNSINTNNEQRDGHLKSADFFDVEKHPEIKFEGAGMAKKDEENYTMTGNLTMKDATLPVTLDVVFGGIGKDAYGRTKAGFTIAGKLNRKDYGLSWTALTEAGGLALGDEVKIHAEVQFVKG